MATKMVVISPSKHAGRISVVGLSPEELDELYGDMEGEFGESTISASVGPPYVFSVAPEFAFRLYRRIVSHCEEEGYTVAPD